jgi:hypothetical protein
MTSVSKLKSSFKTGEFWLILVIAAACLYLESKGISPSEVTEYGQTLIVKIRETLTAWAPVALAVFFGIKRAYLKTLHMRAELQIALAEIRAGKRAE